MIPSITIAPSSYTLMLGIVAAATLPIYAYMTIRSRSISREDWATVSILRRTSLEMKKGIGFSQALLESSRSLRFGPVRTGDVKSVAEFFARVESRSKGMLRGAIRMIRTSYEAGALKAELLEEFANELEALLTLRLERERGARSITSTSIAVGCVVLPFLMGLILSYVKSFTTLGTMEFALIWGMTMTSILGTLLFAGAVAGGLKRYALLSPTLLAIASLIFDVTASVRFV